MHSRKLTNALKCNGSFHRATLVPHTGHSRSYPGYRLIQAYCARNALGVSMLRSPFWVQPDDGNAAKESRPTPVSLFPTLFLAMQQTPRTTPNSIFTGLLALHDCFGPQTSVLNAFVRPDSLRKRGYEATLPSDGNPGLENV